MLFSDHTISVLTQPVREMGIEYTLGYHSSVRNASSQLMFPLQENESVLTGSNILRGDSSNNANPVLPLSMISQQFFKE